MEEFDLLDDNDRSQSAPRRKSNDLAIFSRVYPILLILLGVVAGAIAVRIASQAPVLTDTHANAPTTSDTDDGELGIPPGCEGVRGALRLAVQHALHCRHSPTLSHSERHDSRYRRRRCCLRTQRYGRATAPRMPIGPSLCATGSSLPLARRWRWRLPIRPRAAPSTCSATALTSPRDLSVLATTPLSPPPPPRCTVLGFRGRRCRYALARWRVCCA